MNLFKNKKTRRRNIVIILVPFLILMGFFAYLSVGSVMNMGKGDKVVNSIDSMDYHLRAGATELQIELFKELDAAVNAEEKDDVLIATSVVENFVADFYTWSNKGGSYDVGGMYYVHSPSKGVIYSQARDTFYKYLSSYLGEYKSLDLLEVESIESEGEVIAEGYELDGVSYEAFYVKSTWTYKQKEAFPTDGFETTGYFRVYKNNDGRFEIVQSYGAS